MVDHPNVARRPRLRGGPPFALTDLRAQLRALGGPRELLLRFVNGVDSRALSTGWAMRSMHFAIRDALLNGVAAMQVLLMVAVFASDVDPRWKWSLCVVHLAVAALCLFTARRQVPAWPVVLAVYGTAVADLWVSASEWGVLLFAGNWLVLAASAMPTFLIRGRSAFAVHAVGCLGYSFAVVLAHPDWSAAIPRGQIIAGYSIFLAVRAGMVALELFAEQVDARTAAATRAQQSVLRARSASQEAAEDSRVLHDTVINTLAAVAAGGVAVQDPALVRERCSRDAVLVEELLQKRPGKRAAMSPLEALGTAQLRVRRHGLTDAEVVRTSEDLPDAVVDALGWAIVEVLQNAAKHSGVDVVDVTISRKATRLVFRIEDNGIGFDQRNQPRRGLASSVFARAELRGIDVELRAAPGDGVAITLVAPAPETEEAGNPTLDSDAGGLAAVVTTIRQGAAWMWAVGVLLVGIVLELTSQPGRWTPTYLSIAVGAFAVMIAVIGRDGAGGIRRWSRSVLVVLTVPSFVLSAATSEFGQVDPVLWQLLLSTGILLLLLVASGSRAAGRWAIGLHLSTALVIAVLTWSDSSTGALIMVIGALVGLGLVLGWDVFDRALVVVARRTLHEETALHAARLEELQREAVSEAKLRWRAAGLQRTLELVHRIASGAADPRDATVQRACGDEESYLRQVIQLDPQLVRTGVWLGRALDSAREDGVMFVVRTGFVEPDDAERADAIGALLLQAARAVRSGDDVIVTLYGGGTGDLRLTIVAPAHRLIDATWQAPDGASVSAVTLGAQDMVQIVMPPETGAMGTRTTPVQGSFGLVSASTGQ